VLATNKKGKAPKGQLVNPEASKWTNRVQINNKSNSSADNTSK